MQRLWHLLDWLRARLWLIPALMSIVAVACVYVVLSMGALFPRPDGAVPWWLFGGDASTARDLLSTLLSGMITMTSLVVSITIVVLSLAAGQLGPRLIWNFIGDRQIQLVIGLFIGTILYILLLLRSINESLGPEHVPQAAVTIASALAVACMFALLFHVNKLARSIVSDTMVREVADRLDVAIAALPSDSSADGSFSAEISHGPGCAIGVEGSGYVQFIEYEDVCGVATEEDFVVSVHLRPGGFALRGIAALSIHGKSEISPETRERLLRAIRLGHERTPTQDLEYSIRQLVEVAVRALSPSLNDPFTAIAVIDRLAAALESLARRSPPQSEFRDPDGNIRVIGSRIDFADLVDIALSPLRRAANSQVTVLVVLAERLAGLAAIVTGSKRETIIKHLQMVSRHAAMLPEPEDQRALLAAIEPVLAVSAGDHADHEAGPLPLHQTKSAPRQR